MEGSYAFQLDCLILTPRYGLILEVKNHTGKITQDPDSKKFHKELNGKKGDTDDPIQQVKRQRRKLHKILLKKGLRSYPIVYFVVNANANSVYELIDEADRIVDLIHVLDKIDSLDLLYQKEVVKPYRLRQICHTLVNEHSPIEHNVLYRFGLKPPQ